jgi:predicted metalloprotease with PDZ domain
VENDDQWIDGPIVAAAPGYGGTGSFTVNGIRHHIAWVGLECARPMADFEAAFKKIARATLGMFGGAPFREYWFLLHFGHKLYGGLEHRDSQLTQFDGSKLQDAKDWDGFLRLVAHEYFHSWNVKSIRPQALGPFDYFNENYTQDIWFAEGLTDYFDDMLPLEAGLISKDAYWRARLKDVTHLPDGNPGHRRRSLAENSLDTWIRYYRADEDSVNTDVSYYSKGATLGWCWDAHLQKRTRKRWTLRKLMKEIWKEYGIDAYEPLRDAKPGFTREELLRFAEKITGVPQRALVESWVTARKPLPWREAARFFKVGFTEKVTDSLLHHSGVVLQFKGGAAVAQKVLSGTAAEAAGIAPGDEILAINGTRISDQEKLARTLPIALAGGKELEFLVCRLEKVLTRRLRWRKHEGIGVEYTKL